MNLHDVHILDAESMQWSSPQVSGPTPQERRYHTASVVDRQIYVFGGQYYDQSADLHFECDNQLCVLDVPTLSWVPVPVEGPAPLRRACHSAAVVGRSLFMVGGRYWDVAEDDYIFLNDIQTLDTRPLPVEVTALPGWVDTDTDEPAELPSRMFTGYLDAVDTRPLSSGGMANRAHP